MLFGNSFLGIHQISGAHCIQSSSSNKNRSLERHMFTIKLPPLPPIPIGKVCCGSQKISQKSDVGALLRTLGVMLSFVHLTSLVLSIFFIFFFSTYATDFAEKEGLLVILFTIYRSLCHTILTDLLTWMFRVTKMWTLHNSSNRLVYISHAKLTFSFICANVKN